MEDIKIAKEEWFFNQFDRLLSENSRGDISSIFPIFYYVYRARRYGVEDIHYSEYFYDPFPLLQSEVHDELLDQLRMCSEEALYRNRDRKVYRTYSKVLEFLSINREILIEKYSELIERSIDFCSKNSGYRSAVIATPKSVASLMASLIHKLGVDSVYDPFAGLCSYVVSPEFGDITFYGQEIHEITRTLAKLRLDAAHKTFDISQCNSIEVWDPKGCTSLVTELPLGVKLSSSERFANQYTCGGRECRTLDELVIARFLETKELRKAVILTSQSMLSAPVHQSIRENLCERNYIDTIISLPQNILPYTGAKTAVLILDKDKYDHSVNFIGAEDCSIMQGRNTSLDVQKVMSRVKGTDDTLTDRVELSKIVFKSCDLLPYNYLSNTAELKPGQVLMHFSDVGVIYRGERDYTETLGRVLNPDHLSDNIAEVCSNNVNIEEQEIPRNYCKVEEKCIIFDLRMNKCYLKRDIIPLFISANYTCIINKQEKCTLEYLAYSILTCPNKDAAASGVIPRTKVQRLRIPFFEKLEDQDAVMKRIYRQERKQIEAKLERLNLLSGRSSNLIHSLGITFTNISAGISLLKAEGNNPILESLSDNVKFAFRQINSTGTDFSMVTPQLTKENLFSIIQRYLQGWERYGYKSFEVLPLSSDLSDDTLVMVDVEMLFTALDCLLINAHQHGFQKRKAENNLLQIKIKGVMIEEAYALISISNNGDPLPAGFTLQDFIKRGEVGLNSSQDGLGGHHVYQIAHKFGGKVSIESSSYWLSFNVLLPIYLTSSAEEKFEDYECECV